MLFGIHIYAYFLFHSSISSVVSSETPVATAASVTAATARTRTGNHWPPFSKINNLTWAHLKNTIRCLTSTGGWALNSSVHLRNELKEYTPCGEDYDQWDPCSHLLQGDTLKYYWQPSRQCSPAAKLQPFDTQDFFALMQNRGNVMIVGDSVSGIGWKGWVNDILVALNLDYCPFQGGLYTPVGQMGSLPGVETKIIFVRNDYVSLLDDSITGIVNGITLKPWKERIVSDNISLLVLNRGAHYVSNEVLLRETREVLQYLKEHHPDVSVIWRNTPHGEWDYKKYVYSAAKPFTEPPILDYYDAPYNYGKFDEQNLLVENMIDMYYPEVLYLDVSTSTVLRPDAHLDPLHPCIPGFTSSWFQFIYNALRIIAEHHEKAVEHLIEAWHKEGNNTESLRQYISKISKKEP